VFVQVMVLIVFLLFRVGNHGNALAWTTENTIVFGIMVFSSEFSPNAVFIRLFKGPVA